MVKINCSECPNEATYPPQHQKKTCVRTNSLPTAPQQHKITQPFLEVSAKELPFQVTVAFPRVLASLSGRAPVFKNLPRASPKLQSLILEKKRDTARPKVELPKQGIVFLNKSSSKDIGDTQFRSVSPDVLPSTWFYLLLVESALGSYPKLINHHVMKYHMAPSPLEFTVGFFQTKSSPTHETTQPWHW